LKSTSVRDYRTLWAKPIALIGLGLCHSDIGDAAEAEKAFGEALALSGERQLMRRA
jgi:hypothetical protein